MQNETITDVLGVAQTIKVVINSVALFAIVLLMGDCAGCIDTIEIIEAINTPSAQCSVEEP